MGQIVNLRLLRPMEQGRGSLPVWPRDTSEPPVRHPSRPKLPYHPRGHSRRVLHNYWGLDDATQIDRKANELFAQIERRSGQISQQGQTVAQVTKRRDLGFVAFAPVLVIMVTLAGYTAFQQPSPLTSNTIAQTSLTTIDPATPAQVVAAAPTTRPEEPVSLVMDAPFLAAPQIQSQPPFGSDVVTRQPQTMIDSPPALSVQTFVSDAPVIGQRTDLRPNMLFQMPEAGQQADPFVCRDCVSVTPYLAGFTVSVFSADANPATDINALAALGAQVGPATALQIVPASNQVRFYHTQDAVAADRLAARYGAVLVDLSWFPNGAVTGQIDLLLAANPAITKTGN